MAYVQVVVFEFLLLHSLTKHTHTVCPRHNNSIVNAQTEHSILIICRVCFPIDPKIRLFIVKSKIRPHPLQSLNFNHLTIGPAQLAQFYFSLYLS